MSNNVKVRSGFKRVIFLFGLQCLIAAFLLRFGVAPSGDLYMGFLVLYCTFLMVGYPVAFWNSPSMAKYNSIIRVFLLVLIGALATFVGQVFIVVILAFCGYPMR